MASARRPYIRPSIRRFVRWSSVRALSRPSVRLLRLGRETSPWGLTVVRPSGVSSSVSSAGRPSVRPLFRPPVTVFLRFGETYIPGDHPSSVRSSFRALAARPSVVHLVRPSSVCRPFRRRSHHRGAESWRVGM